MEFDNNIAGYALGKIETLERRDENARQEGIAGVTQNECTGHITSIAVEKTFRRSGIATDLMRIMHKEMCSVPSLQSINLLCRVSNIAAIQHYKIQHGYTCKFILKAYYADGEDGWFMEWERR